VATNPLGRVGRTVNAKGVVTDGLYAEIKEIVGDYIVVKADDFEDAVSLSDGCPTLAIGGTVEIRNVMDITPK
jgi:hypothetical protein